MAWQLRYERDGEAVEVLVKRGMPVPDWYKEKPSEISSLDYFWLQAFEELGSCRPVGMSVGQIPWTAVKQYADHHGFCQYMTDCLCYIIRRLDSVYLKWVSEEQKRASKSK